MLSKTSFKFLNDLSANNNREWFIANKQRYDKYKTEYHQLIQQFLDILKPIDSDLELLEVKNCTFRVNRDIRFSKNKMPYKNHMGIWFPKFPAKNSPGYYVHIMDEKSFVAGGLYSPEADDLKKIRKEIAFFHDDLEKIVSDKKFKKIYGNLDQENALKNAPKDYDKDHEAIHFLKLKSFTASHNLSNDDITSKDFVQKTAEKIIILKPLCDFLARGLNAEH